MLSYKKLMQAQRVEWPNSVQLKPYQMIAWAHEAPNNNERMVRFMRIANTTQFSRVLFYLTANGHIGARYGLRPEEYISGFNFKAVELYNDQLVDTDRYVV